MGGITERAEGPFFRKFIRDGMHGATAQFDARDLLGSTRGGTLNITQEAGGVYFDVAVPQSLPLPVEYVERREVADIQLVWQVYEDDWACDGGYPTRHLRSARLLEINLLTRCPREPVNVAAALHSLARHTGHSIGTVETLSARNALCELFGFEPPRPRKPTLLGRNGRQAHVEVIEAQEPGAPILDHYAVQATPAEVKGTP